MNGPKHRQISLSEDLCKIAEQKFAGHFDTIDLLLEFVLQELTRDDAKTLDQAEQAILERRLRDLGYI